MHAVYLNPITQSVTEINSMCNATMYIQWHILFNYLLIILCTAQENLELELCEVETDVAKLCKKYEDYRPNDTPKPLPTIVTPYVDLKSVIDVSEDKKSLTLYIYLVTHWYDKEVFVHTPKGKE